MRGMGMAQVGFELHFAWSDQAHTKINNNINNKVSQI